MTNSVTNRPTQIDEESVSIGPTLLYDKSALQALNADEAFWLGTHFRTNLTPVFFVEVLADLHKSAPAGRSPEDVVRALARKVGQLGTMPNVLHSTIILGELLGHEAPMRGIPLVPAGREVTTADGRSAMVMNEPPEMAAFNRWREEDFHGAERDYGRAWRQMLERLDLGAMADAVCAGVELKFSDLAAVKAAADHVASPKNSRHRQLLSVLEVMGIPTQYRTKIVSRWKEAGGPALREYAPYAHYVLTVDLFFNLAIASGHIASTRASNKVDMAYLYYLPFCQIFTSGDRLHKRTAPLFLRPDQAFIPAEDLKADLAALVEYYDALPEEVKQSGTMKYAAYPPLKGEYEVCRLFDRFLPGWREHAASPMELSPEENAELMARLHELTAAADRPPPGSRRFAEVDRTAVQFSVNRKVGRWKVF